ncbi:VWA domain-containing protein [Mycolicibacterium sp. P1-18]|nr:VWA domain-containing protein [Mycolicibacterium sp. P1-18]
MAALLDRSGSMETIKSDTEGGFNALVATQRTEPGEALVTLAQFDTEYEVVYANRPIAEVPPLVLQPRGMTALLDAIGRLIADVGTELAALDEDERPGDVIVVVMTDGMENSSVEWTAEAVNSAIRRQEREFSWYFVFLGANMDAVAVGAQLGFSADRTMTYEASDEGVASAMAATTGYVSRQRRSVDSMPAPGFSEEDRVSARGSRR